MARKIYPNSIRSGCFANMYCEIAMELYYNAAVSYERIKKAEYSWNCYSEYDSMNKSIVTTIVFSAMTIEAFLNDYAAACLGDSDFYDTFDKLSLLGKFELIARFILKSGRLDRSKSYYSRLKSLVKSRNEHVHCKSKSLNIQEFSSDEVQKAECMDLTEQEFSRLNATDIKSDIAKALDALKAIHDVAVYFDEYDSNITAVSRLFHEYGFIVGNETERQYKAVVFKLLGIEISEYELLFTSPAISDQRRKGMLESTE